MTSDFDQENLLDAVEARLITMPNGLAISVTMTRMGWTSFDDLAADEFFDADTLIDYADHLRGDDTEHEFGYWFELTMMRVQERERQDDRSLAEFNRFCALQPRTDEGLRRIEEEVHRLRVMRR